MVVTWAATPVVIRLARRLGAMDQPSDRRIHATPTPRIGGVAVFLGFLAGLLVAAHAAGILFTVSRVEIYWSGFAIAATAMLLVGLFDDVRGLSFKWKFGFQIALAILIWFCGFRIEVITHPFGGKLDLFWLAFPVTLLWIVGVTNAVNLIDGLDGLAAGIALIITGSVAVIAFDMGRLGVTAASVALAGSLLGFLIFNFNPAKIFLGDSGSLFLGFVLAVTSIRGSQKGPTAVAILVPLLIFGLPLMDTCLAVFRRLFRLGHLGTQSHKPVRYMLQNCSQIFLPDRGHVHHQLLDLGMSHRGAVLTLYLVGAVLSFSALAVVILHSPWLAGLLLTVLAVTIAIFLAVLHRRIWRFGQARRLERSSDKAPAARVFEAPPPPLPGLTP